MGQARDVVEQCWSLFDAGRLDDAMQLCQPDVELAFPGGVALVGPTAVKALLDVFLTAFPDMQRDLHQVVEVGDTIAIEFTETGVHSGPFRAPDGQEIPPTGRTVVFDIVDVIKVRDGKIASWHGYFDQLTFLVQLGLMPEPAAT